MMRWWFLAMIHFGTGCATARLVGERPPMTPIEAGPPRTVVVEPLFDRAAWKTSTRTELVDTALPGPLVGPGPSGAVAVTRTVTEKPLFARPETLAAVFERLLPTIQRLRPTWRVAAPGLAPTLASDAVIVRTVIDGNELTQSDRPLKNAAFAFGLVLLPLQILAAFPVDETERVSGLLEKVTLDPRALQQRLVKYASQPDFAVNLSGLPPKRQPFALEVEYEEGLFADESPRPQVLIEGFVEKLAWAIVTFVEEEPP